MIYEIMKGAAWYIPGLILLVQALLPVPGQSFKPGASYYSGPYVEYLHGDLPLIISVPHGGWEKPDSIPEREGKSVKSQDIYTIEIAYEIQKTIHEISGRYPFVVINHLHRTRLDANRNIREAADGNPGAELVWNLYHSTIDNVKDTVSRMFGKGLFIDLHGHRHKIARIELGYLLSAEELRLDDELLNSGLLDEYTGVRNLTATNPGNSSLSEIIRGANSLGSILCRRGQICMPSMKSPMPGTGEPYFSGGYNTMRHGSAGGGVIDGIQIEVDLKTRTNKSKQKQVAEDIAFALMEFLQFYYQQENLFHQSSRNF